MIRFIHSADLHLGKTFGQAEVEERGRLAEARHKTIGRLAEEARAFGAGHIILAGDIWDSEVPSERVLRQSLGTIGEQSDLTWALLPGNHDLHREGGLWERIAASAPENLVALTEAAPLRLADGLWLLPAPCASKDPGRDITRWMDDATTPEGAVRIGVAHGPVAGFGDAPSDSVIDPGRVGAARLDYLALGDWHGWTPVGPRCLYPGTPEPDRFRDGSGYCAAVSITGPGAEPEIRRVATAEFAWVEREIDAGLGEAPRVVLDGLMPEGFARRNVLLSLVLTGTATLEHRAQWLRAIEELTPALPDLRVDLGRLDTLFEADDLDRIDRRGALREAAESLRADLDDEGLPATDRAAARRALDLLYSWSLADGAEA